MHHSAADHADHDLTLIAGHAAGDLLHPQLGLAAALIASCPTCDELHRDLVALAAATRALPRELRAPRDFRLSAEQAARLRRGGWLRGLLRPFASARSAARPMATAFTSVGVAGLLVAAFAPGLLGGAASAPGGGRNLEVSGAAAPSAPAGDHADPLVGVSPAPGGPAAPGFQGTGGDTGTGSVEGQGEGPGEAAGGSSDKDTREDGSTGRLDASGAPGILLAGSLAFLLVGLAIFGLRIAARRLD